MPSLDRIRQDARDLAAAKGWATKTPEERVLYLVAEVGEVAEAVLELRKAAVDNPARVTSLRMDVALELYDVIWNACDLANILDLDLDAAATTKKRILDEREW